MTRQIFVNDPAIPLDVERRGTFDLGSRDQRVVLDDITEFLSPNARNERAIEGAASLLYIKLTITISETAIGVSWHHTLGRLADGCDPLFPLL